MELYRIYYDSNNPSYSVVITKFNFYVPGEAETVRSVPGTALINGRKVNNIIDPNRNYVYNTRHAEYSDSTNALRDVNIVNNQLLLGNGTYLPQVLFIWGTDVDTNTYNENITSEISRKSFSVSSSTVILKYHIDIKLKYNIWEWPWGWSSYTNREFSKEFEGYVPLENVKVDEARRFTILLEKQGNAYILKIVVNDNCGVIIQKARIWIEVIQA